MKIATEEIKAERGIPQGDEELEMLTPQEHDIRATSFRDTSYRGADTVAPSSHDRIVS